jgi:hypothetical protein
MKGKRAYVAAAFALSVTLAGAGHAEKQWTEYRNQDLGFRMLVPPGVQPVTQVRTDGWGSITFKSSKTTSLSAVVKMGPAAPIDRIREYAAGISGLGADQWTRVGDPQRDTAAGFAWVETWTASDGNTLIFAILAHGPRGNYVIFVTTTVAEYQKRQAQFALWASSINVF